MEGLSRGHNMFHREARWLPVVAVVGTIGMRERDQRPLLRMLSPGAILGPHLDCGITGSLSRRPTFFLFDIQEREGVRYHGSRRIDTGRAQLDVSMSTDSSRIAEANENATAIYGVVRRERFLSGLEKAWARTLRRTPLSQSLRFGQIQASLGIR